ncbi:MAG: histidine kinase [Dehalococcoidia bacterium]
MRFQNLSLGFKLNIALLIFLLVLGSATSAIFLYGFNRTQDNANQRSQEALEEEGKLALQALVGGIADAGALQIEYAAEVGQRAGHYLQDFEATGASAPYDVSRFVKTEDGVWYDPDPNRVSDVVVPNHVVELDEDIIDDIEYSAPLDALLPALAEGFPGQLSGDAFHPFAIIFVGLNGVGRYYPPIGIQETTPAELDVSDFDDRFGPVANPERESVWTPPYEDLQGRGLVITAQTPIYDGDDTFRGIFEVDLSIASLVEQINQLKPTASGFTFYVDSEGEIMQTAAYGLLSREAEENAELTAVLDAMKAGQAGQALVSDHVLLDGEEFFIAHTPMSPIGGSIAVAAPVEEVTAQAATITAGIDEEGNRTFQFMLIAMGALFVSGLAGATWLNRRLLVAPLQQLAAGTRAVAAGDMSVRVALDRRDELGALAGSFNTMVEKLRESELLLERRVEDRTRELDALLRADAELFRSLDLDEVLQALVDVAVDLLGADKSLVTIWDRDRGEAQLRASRNMSTESVELFKTALTRPGHGSLPDDFDLVIHRDLPLSGTTLVEERLVYEIAQREGIALSVEVPIKSPARGVLGGFGIGYTRPHEFSKDDERLFTALAERAAVAIENAALYERAQQAALLEERQRLARELHDSVSQALYGIALGARTARTLLDQDASKAAEPLDYVLSLAEAGLTEMRALIFELRPESLESEGVVASLERQIAAARVRHELEIEFNAPPEPDASLRVKEAIYRIAQEALHNIAKHARAKRVWVTLEAVDGSLSLEVRDDGVGFDPSADFAGHLGLRSMRERAAKAGGKLDITSEVGSGSRIRVTLPASA